MCGARAAVCASTRRSCSCRRTVVSAISSHMSSSITWSSRDVHQALQAPLRPPGPAQLLAPPPQPNYAILFMGISRKLTGLPLFQQLPLHRVQRHDTLIFPREEVAQPWQEVHQTVRLSLAKTRRSAFFERSESALVAVSFRSSWRCSSLPLRSVSVTPSDWQKYKTRNHYSI